MHRSMGVRHMFLAGAVSTRTITAWMTGESLAVVVDHDGVVRGLDFNFLLYQVVRDGVIMFVVLDVVIDMHSGLFNMSILVRLGRQGA